jgi:hypothetical protein
MKKIYDSQKRFHGYKSQFDYYRTSEVITKVFRNEILTINDKINYKTFYKEFSIKTDYPV